jgi:penicillin-insensitive murein DD-endopeptidase
MRFLVAVSALVLLLASPFVLQAQQAPPPPNPGAAAEPDGPKEPSAAATKDASPSAVQAATPTPAKAKNGKAQPKPTPARELFGAAKKPAALAARSIGFYAKGCLAGAAALPVDGPAWQAMRLSRNRNWGHPSLVKMVEKLATEAKANDGWPGLLVGDLSQPRGGPMLTGHASHQVGLDADIWLTPMPDRRLTEREREDLSATSMLASYDAVDPKIWTDAHVKLIKRAASYPEVDRIFVHPAIKKALCAAAAKDKDRGWLHKVRPYWGHHYHFHIRAVCPKGSANCESQPALNTDDGCGKEVANWIALVKPKVPGPPPKEPVKPAPPVAMKPPLSLDQLPAECRAVLASGPDGIEPPKPMPVKAKKAVPKKGAKRE